MADPTRRALLATAGGLLTLAAAPSDRRAWDFRFDSIDGGTLDLAQFRGHVLLVANTASFCAYTPQYRGLEALHARLQAAGLVVIGVPSQDFGQESDSNGKVKKFCDATFGVQFPMSGINAVSGPNAHPFYAWVRSVRDGWEPQWNFNKVLIGRDGAILGTFGSSDEPDGPRLTSAIDAALRAPAPAV